MIIYDNKNQFPVYENMLLSWKAIKITLSRKSYFMSDHKVCIYCRIKELPFHFFFDINKYNYLKMQNCVN